MSFEILQGATIGTNTLHPAALLQVDSTNKGFLGFPRMTAAQRTAIGSPTDGLVVYQTDGLEGVYVYTNSLWFRVASAGRNAQAVTRGNTTLTNSVLSNPLKIAASTGTLYLSGSSAFTSPTGNRILFTDAVNTVWKGTILFTCTPTKTATSRLMDIGLAINGDTSAPSLYQNAGGVTNVPLNVSGSQVCIAHACEVTLNTGDFVEIYMTRRTGGVGVETVVANTFSLQFNEEL